MKGIRQNTELSIQLFITLLRKNLIITVTRNEPKKQPMEGIANWTHNGAEDGEGFNNKYNPFPTKAPKPKITAILNDFFSTVVPP